jgi:hypothetical protein
MKIIINEQQYQQLFESDSKKIEFYQSYVNNSLKNIINNCEGEERYYYNNICNYVSSINNIKVVSVTKSSISPTTKKPLINVKTPIVIDIMINYESIVDLSFDDFTHQLRYEISHLFGNMPTNRPNFNIIYQSNNLNKNHNW